jgi:Zn-dependent protease with chaperone function
MGYGHELMVALQGFIDMGHDAARAKQRLSARMWSSHPPTHKRMRALDKHMAKRAATAAPAPPAAGRR